MRFFARKSDFLKNVLINFSGTAIATLIGFAATPFVTRIFAPEDFGRVAFVSTIAANVGLLSTLTLPSAIVIPKSRGEAYRLLRLCLYLLLLSVILTTAFLLLFSSSILGFFNMEPIGNWIFALPLFIALGELSKIAVNLNVRQKRFNANASGAVAKGILVRGSQIFYGVTVAPSFFGLLLGRIVGDLARLCFLIRFRLKTFFLPFFLKDKSGMISLIKKYKNYPTWVLPAGFVNALSASMPIYILAIYYEADSVGYFSFAQTLLNHPYAMLSASVTPVFFQKANELYHQDFAGLQDFAVKIYNRLIIVGTIVFGAAVFFSDLLFPLVFGPKWVESGVLAGYLAIYFLFRFISVPLVPIFRVLRKEYFDFIGSSSIFVLRCAALVFGVMFFSLGNTVLLFSLAGAIPCLVNLVLVFWVLKINLIPIVIRTFLVIVFTVSFFYFTRMFINHLIG
ncbi:MAG: oligosaccharide flippase family protein [Bacteroidetes bacterium]|nr:oligosaccharide flippase family protein [Bacteroidota bacterium]